MADLLDVCHNLQALITGVYSQIPLGQFMLQ